MRALAAEDRRRVGVHVALHAAARHRAGQRAVLRDDELGAQRARRRAARRDDRRQREALAPLPQAVDVGQDVPHASCLLSIADSRSPSASRLARSCPDTKRSTDGSAARMPGRERLVLRAALQRVDPDDRVGRAVQARHLAPDELVVLALPAVGDDQDDGAAGQRPAPPDVVVGLQRRADPRAAGPVDDAGGRAGERLLGVAGPQLGRQARQARAEGEDLDAAAGAHGRVEVEQQRAGVGLHRARHVAQHDELARRLACAGGSGARTGSPPVAIEPRASARRSRTCPRRWGCRRRERRRGRRAATAEMSLRAAANSSGVIAAKSLRRRTSCALVPISSGSPLGRRVAARPCASRRTRWARLGGWRGSSSRRLRRADGLAQEPGVEGAVEDVELLAPRDERRAQRPVDVVLPRDVDAVEAVQRVGEAARPDLQPGLAQHAAEGDDVAGQRVAHAVAAAASRASRSSWATRVVAHGLEVLVVLQHRPERLLDDLGVELLAAQRGQRVGPVDRLGDARRLGQVHRRAARRRTPPPRRPAAPARRAPAAARSRSRARAAGG